MGDPSSTAAEGRGNAVIRRRASGADDQPWGAIAAFLVPAILFFALFTAFPILKTIYNSFHTIRPNRPDVFVGFANYVQLLTNDAVFARAMFNTFIWATVAPIVDVILGLLLAACLYAKVPFSRFFRVAWFSPVLISYVVVGIIWLWIYNFDWGVVNVALRAVGLGSWAHVWLGDPKTALWAIILVDAWKWVGFHMVVCLAALSSLPREVMEASELDNCGWFARLIHIEVPMIKGTLISLLILAFIGKMKIFDLVWIMTKGGPLWSTETLATYTFKRAFEWSTFDLGYPSAIAVVSFLVVMVFVLVTSYLFRQRDKLEF